MHTHTHITVVCLYIPSLKPNSLRMNIYSLQSIKGFAFHIDIHVDSNLKKKIIQLNFFYYGHFTSLLPKKGCRSTCANNIFKSINNGILLEACLYFFLLPLSLFLSSFNSHLDVTYLKWDVWRHYSFKGSVLLFVLVIHYYYIIPWNIIKTIIFIYSLNNLYNFYRVISKQIFIQNKNRSKSTIMLC